MNIKNTLFGFILLGMGGVAGYFIADKKLKARYQEDLVDVQDFYYKKLQELGVMEEDFEPEEQTDEELEKEFQAQFQKIDDMYNKSGLDGPADPTRSGADFDGDELMFSKPKTDTHNNDKKRTETSKDVHYDKGKGRPIINYNKPPLEKILAELQDEGDEEIDEIEEDEMDEAYAAEIEARAEEFAQRRYENQLSGEPYCVNYDELEDTPEEYEKQILYYYAQDRTLCEDDDSIVDDEEEVVGLDYEDVLSMQTIAWVRNDKLCMIYEIHRIDDSYARVVANAIETPREREFRLVARRKQALDDK